MPSENFIKLLGYMRAQTATEPPLDQMRSGMDDYDKRAKLPAELTQLLATGSPCEAEWLVPAGVNRGVILYVHGGGFQLGSIRSHRHVAAYLGAAAGARALIFNFRLAPEHPYPAGAQDCLEVYRWLLQQVPATEIVLCGDSSGAAMALNTMIAARDSGLPVPAAAIVFSPVLDITSHMTIQDGAHADPTLKPAWARAAMRAYVGDHDPRDPGISPMFADLRGLPPILIQTGSIEFLTPDTYRFAMLCERAGVSCVVDQWDAMVHVWQWFAPKLPEAMSALEKAGAFVRRAVAA